MTGKTPAGTQFNVGVIADTHGLLRQEALKALESSDLVIHAGDVGKLEILEALRAVAPLVAIRGNIDTGEWAQALPETEIVEIGGARLYVLHDLLELDLDPAAARFSAVISGHSHRPMIKMHNGVLFLNPGSAGPRRFTLPVTLARVIVKDGLVEARIIPLDW